MAEFVDPASDDPGQALALRHTPSVASVRVLSALVDGGVPTGAAHMLRDPRIPDDEWESVLRREIAFLSAWAARRALAAAKGADPVPTAWPGEGGALSLVPRHGHAVHLLRRAVPLALCGIPTEVAGHVHQEPLLRKQIDVLRDLLRLPGDLLSLSGRPARDAVRTRGADDLVVATGHRYTCGVVLAATKATVLGAAGSCVLVVGSDRRSLAALGERLREHDQPASCTRFGGVWLTTRDRGERATASVPRDVVASVHPSVVYVLDGPVRQEVAGYTALRVDAAGAVDTLVGFGRDPRYGWPGDFLV